MGTLSSHSSILEFLATMHTTAFTIVVVALCFAVSVNAYPKATVLDALRCSSTFGTLKAAINKAELTDALTKEDADITLFAPTNAAFAAALEPLGISAEELLESDKLVDILRYHVVKGKKLSSDLSNGDALPTLLGDELEFSTNGEDLMVNDNALVVIDDIETANGVVHMIDAVLEPPMTKAETSKETSMAKTNEDGFIVKDGSDMPILG